MPSFKCRGVSVEFPFKPYECQKDYMDKVIECLQNSKNGILESPTGTGKTVSLLCSTLAWRRAYIATQELRRCIQDDGSKKEEGGYRQELSKELKEGATGSGWGEVQEGNFLDRPRIIYASRTHSQLSQAVDQLKDTAYRPRVSIIGSREQLCIHPEVKAAESNTAKVHMCRAKVDNKMCHFHNNLEHKKGEKAFSEGILDVEDLVKLGTQHKVCPYYMARELKTSADIVFMPYNYLLDPKSRRIHGVELSGNVVIFDEAHNVERICEESASFELTSYDIASCIEETTQLLKKTVEIEDLNQQFRDDNAAESDFAVTDLAGMKKLFMKLEELISAIHLPTTGSGVTKPGGYIYELFAKASATFETKTEILQICEKMVSHLTSSSSIFQNKAAGLQKFCDIINIVFRKDTPPMSGHNQATETSACYKVHIRASEGSKKKQRTDLWSSSKAPEKKGFVLSYWCFSPGFSMQELVSQGVRSIILTSGTLAPLSSFKSELRIDFPIQLENPHVIEKHQMQVGIVTRGPDKTVLNSSYQTRFNRDYILSLGNTIVNFARIVPNGLLVFFPSYPVMNHCLEIWQEDGISNRITQYKQMFVEPRGKTDFIEAMEGFYEKVRDPTLNGASFFAVCRGKVSEGLDFADTNGRAVVITGLPFPPRMDPRVTLKMQYLDEMRRKDKRYLSGQDWYRQQASRAVNQAIGRVIRHKEDFGAILLCDIRFSSRDSRAQLPLWLRPYVCVYEQFGHTVRDLTNFFKIAEKKMPQPKAKKPRAKVPVMYETETNGVHLPGQSNRFPAMKARELDSHVHSLKRNRDGSHVSEAQLKTMYEEARPSTSSTSTRGVGLLDALNHAESSKSSGEGYLLGEMSRDQRHLKVDEEPRKRKKIVIKQRTFDTDEDEPVAKDSVTTVSSVKKSGAAHTTMSAQAYIEEVKQTMSKESYDKFSGLIRNYKKTCDFNSLVSTLADLFVDDSTKHYLFRNFYTFVRPIHKKKFDDVCHCVTGQGCGFKPEHAIPRKKLEKHKESAASHKTENEVENQSVVSAHMNHLNTDTHLNQGRIQTTHNAPQCLAESVTQGNPRMGSRTIHQEPQSLAESVTEVNLAKNSGKPHRECRNVQDAKRGFGTGSEMDSDPHDRVSKTSDCGLTKTRISHNELGTSSISVANAQSTIELMDGDEDLQQGSIGMHHNTKQNSEIDKGTCINTSIESGMLDESKTFTAVNNSKTDCFNEQAGSMKGPDMDDKTSQIVSEVLSVKSKSQFTSEARPPQPASLKTSLNHKLNGNNNHEPATNLQLKSSLVVKKKQTSIRDLFSREPKEDSVSTAPEHQREMSQNGSSQRKQNTLRKVLIPETPDKEEEDEFNTSQESNSSLLSTPTSDMECYDDIITLSVEKLKKKRLCHRESEDSDDLHHGDETGVKKEKKSRRKLSLLDEIENDLCTPLKTGMPMEPTNDEISRKKKSEFRNLNKTERVGSNYSMSQNANMKAFKKRDTDENHHMRNNLSNSMSDFSFCIQPFGTSEHSKKESNKDVCESYSSSQVFHKAQMQVSINSTDKQVSQIGTSSFEKAKFTKVHTGTEKHKKNIGHNNIHKSHTLKCDKLSQALHRTQMQDAESCGGKGLVKAGFCEKAYSTKSHVATKQHRNKEKLTDVYKIHSVKHEESSQATPGTQIQGSKSSGSKEILKTESDKYNMGTKTHRKKERHKDVYRSHSAKQDLSPNQFKLPIPDSINSCIVSIESKLVTSESNTSVQDDDNDDFKEKVRVHKKKTKIRREYQEDIL